MARVVIYDRERERRYRFERPEAKRAARYRWARKNLCRQATLVDLLLLQSDARWGELVAHQRRNRNLRVEFDVPSFARVARGQHRLSRGADVRPVDFGNADKRIYRAVRHRRLRNR